MQRHPVRVDVHKSTSDMPKEVQIAAISTKIFCDSVSNKFWVRGIMYECYIIHASTTQITEVLQTKNTDVNSTSLLSFNRHSNSLEYLLTCTSR